MNKSINDKHALVRLLRLLILTYVLGWFILVLNVGRVPLLAGYYWQIGSGIAMALTLWLAVSLSSKALTWWAAFTMTVVTVRSFSYLSEGIWNPLGVWLLVLSGVSITGLAVISVNVLSGHEEKFKR